MRGSFLVALLFFTTLLLINVVWQGKSSLYVEHPRRGEALISASDFYHCVKKTLVLHGSEGSSFAKYSSTSTSIPMLIIPVMLDYTDLKAFVCNLTVGVQHYVVVQNGAFQPTIDLLRGLQQYLLHQPNGEQFSSRVTIRFHTQQSIGYARAVNEGFRIALKRLPEEVPWVMVANTDVRFGHQTLARFSADINALTGEKDRRALHALKEEEHAKGKKPVAAGHQGSTHASAVVHRSAVLPDRIRRLPPQELRQSFNQHYGLFVLPKTVEMYVFVRSRLHIEVLGLLDENFYPAYGEDFDLLWRSEALGFRNYHLALHYDTRHWFVHYRNANLKMTQFDSFSANVITGYRMIWMKNRQQLQQSSTFLRQHRTASWKLEYRKHKWFPTAPNVFQQPGSPYFYPIPFNGTHGVDEWVRDDERLRRLDEIGEGKKCVYDYKPYNYTLLDLLNHL